MDDLPIGLPLGVANR